MKHPCYIWPQSGSLKCVREIYNRKTRHIPLDVYIPNGAAYKKIHGNTNWIFMESYEYINSRKDLEKRYVYDLEKQLKTMSSYLSHGKYTQLAMLEERSITYDLHYSRHPAKILHKQYGK
jgi:hypothetical protein